MGEIVKLIVASLLCLQSDCNWNVSEFFKLIRKEFIDGWKDFLKLFVPSGLYVIQNNLQYISADNLPADVFQVLYQMKVITTAIFSVTMLSRKLSAIQWISIFSLAVGIALVQLSQSHKGASSDAQQAANLVGLTAVVCASITSGFAGVYFEKVLKSTGSSIWLRNIQLAIIGLGISGIGCLANDLDVINRDGFYRGYNNIVWMVILLNAGGGLVVAVVVKYADNILKGFAAGTAILLSVVISYIFIGETSITTLFVLGATVVIGSAFAFAVYVPKPTMLPSPSQAAVAGLEEDDVPEEEIEFIPRSPGAGLNPNNKAAFSK